MRPESLRSHPPRSALRTSARAVSSSQLRLTVGVHPFPSAQPRPPLASAPVRPTPPHRSCPLSRRQPRSHYQAEVQGRVGARRSRLTCATTGSASTG